MTHVWVVVTDNAVDNVYVFGAESDAWDFAATYEPSATYVTEEVIINRVVAREMIAERTADEEAS